MYSIKNGFVYLALFIVILSVTVHETEGRRLVLRGRRTITRHYYSGLAIPAWLVVVFVALGEIVFGIVLFFALRQLVLTKSEEATNTYQPALLEEESH